MSIMEIFVAAVVTASACVHAELVLIGNPTCEDGTVLRSVHGLGFILLDHALVSGVLREYRFTSAARSRGSFQIWRPVGPQYRLVANTAVAIPGPGNYSVDPGLALVVWTRDLVGFISYDVNSPVSHTFDPQTEGTRVVVRTFNTSRYPEPGRRYTFQSGIYDAWMFALSVVVDTEYDRENPASTDGPGLRKLVPVEHIFAQGSNNTDLVRSRGAGELAVTSTASQQNVLIGSLVPAVFILGVAGALIGFFIYRRRQNAQKDTDSVDDFKIYGMVHGGSTYSVRVFDEDPVLPSSLLQYSLRVYDTEPVLDKLAKELTIDRDKISLHETIHESEYATIVRGMAIDLGETPGETLVAVKMPKDSSGEFEKQTVLQEIEALRVLLPHRNVLQMIGCSLDKAPPMLVLEYTPNGHLSDYLRDIKDNSLHLDLAGHANFSTTKNLVDFGVQIASGMAFLSRHTIMHRDLAARSVLLAEGPVCKITNFGFAKDIIENHQYARLTDSRLPVRWMPPEALFQSVYTSKSDIWAFGVLLWEITTLGDTPYRVHSSEEVLKIVKKGQKLSRPPHCKEELYTLMCRCWKTKPQQRPSFTTLEKALQRMRDAHTDLLQLEKFTESPYGRLDRYTPSEIM